MRICSPCSFSSLPCRLEFKTEQPNIFCRITFLTFNFYANVGSKRLPGNKPKRFKQFTLNKSQESLQLTPLRS